jgi:hypothetical protein
MHREIQQRKVKRGTSLPSFIVWWQAFPCGEHRRLTCGTSFARGIFISGWFHGTYLSHTRHEASFEIFIIGKSSWHMALRSYPAQHRTNFLISPGIVSTFPPAVIWQIGKSVDKCFSDVNRGLAFDCGIAMIIAINLNLSLRLILPLLYSLCVVIDLQTIL